MSENYDPAIEAVQRAWAKRYGATTPGLAESISAGGIGAFIVVAAREALGPIRDRHRPCKRDDPRAPYEVVCAYCLGPKKWPCPDAVDAYTTEELDS